MTGFETVLYERQGRVGVITLNRPRALNTYNMRMRDELFELLQCIRLEDEVGALVLFGAGDKAFCAGADLSEFLTAPSIDVARRVRDLRDLWREFRCLPMPTLAAVHGFVLGSGIEMALSCDIRMASDDAMLGLPEMGLGILPGAGGTQLVPRSAGVAHTLDMLLTNRRWTAREALARGLVSRVVPRGELRTQALELAARLAQAPAPAMRLAKRALRGGHDLSLQQGLQLERRLVAQMTRSARDFHS